MALDPPMSDDEKRFVRDARAAVLRDVCGADPARPTPTQDRLADNYLERLVASRREQLARSIWGRRK